MQTRYVIIKHNQEAYKKAPKKKKSEMPNELSEILNMNRQYVGYLLRASGKEVIRQGNIVVVADQAKHNLSRRGRKRIYNQGVVKVLEVLWYFKEGIKASKTQKEATDLFLNVE